MSGLQNLKSRAIGLDLIHNEMLKQLSPVNRRSLLHLFNLLFESGFSPNHWKTAIVVPLLKPGKPPNDVASYRPISLTSCVAKVFERVIKFRLQWHCEHFNCIPKFQAGFRPGFSTFDHIVRLESHIKESFNKGQNTYAVFLDISKAYDSVWIPALLYKLSKLKISGSILNWLKHFLTNRSFTVRINNKLSSPAALKRGVPQGGVLSPTLWLAYMYDFPIPTPLCHTALFADDIEFHTSSNSNVRAAEVLQPYLNRIGLWATDWCLVFSIDKCVLLIFSRRRSMNQDLTLTLNNMPIPIETTFKFLGVHFDKKLSWNAHVSITLAKASRNLNAIKILARGKTGLNFRSLVRLYKSLIRSRLEYGAVILSSLSKSQTYSFEVLQNAAMRSIIGAFKSTSVALLNWELNIEPIDFRWKSLAINYLLNLNAKPYNMTYHTASSLVYGNIKWKPRSTPAIVPLCKNLNLIDNLNIFKINASTVRPLPPPPWQTPHSEFSKFPITKKMSAQNPGLALAWPLFWNSTSPNQRIP